jgi:hypothetical protein
MIDLVSYNETRVFTGLFSRRKRYLMENRNYCVLLQNVVKDCKIKNYKNHQPCKEILDLIEKLKCYDLSERLLFNVKPIEIPKLDKHIIK